MKQKANIKTLLTSAMLLLFGWFWISSSLFTHLHVVNGQLAAHSHPFTTNSHSHTAAEFFGYQQFSSFNDNSDNLYTATELFASAFKFIVPTVQQHIYSYVGHSLSLRAPPVISFL